MIIKVTFLLGFLALANTAAIAPLFTPAAPVSPVSSAYSPTYNPTNNNIRATPAPIYEETQEDNYADRIGQDSHKFLSTIYPYTRNGAILTRTIQSNYDQTLGTPIVYNPTYTLSSPLAAKIISGPVTYTTHTHSTPFEQRTRITSFATKTGLAYNTHTPIAQNEAMKTSINYAESPAVSHVTYTGLGTMYTW